MDGSYDHFLHLPPKEDLFNPLIDVSTPLKEEDQITEFYKLCNEYYSPEFGVKYLIGVNLYPYQMSLMRCLLNHKFPLLLMSRGAGKSFCIAIYAVLHGILFPGSKIVLVSAGFRQAKNIFQYIERIRKNSPIFQSLSDKPSHTQDRHSIRLHTDSYITALPMGDGGKIRGERANVVIADEFDEIDKQIFDVVIRGFSATELEPFEATKEFLMKMQGKGPKQEEDRSQIAQGNKIILAGTAGFKDGNFYRMFSQYAAIINNKIQGDLGSHKELLGENVDLENNVVVDYRDYCIIRYKYNELPPKYTDEKMINNASATMPKIYFDMEYNCFRGDTKIITDRGLSNIENIKIGDKVLTHKGRFRKVTEVLQNYYSGPMIKYKTWGCNQNYHVTPNHPYWNLEEDWSNISDLEEFTSLKNLDDISGRNTLDLRDYVDYFTQREDRLFPKLPAILDLDFDFGVVVGYYAAEGSVGTHGRAVVFSLDGHTGTDIQVYVDHLRSSIARSLGIESKVYRRDNVASVTVNSRLLADLFKKICPGVAHEKFIDPEILFSNEEFMKGVIVGYWNGDGHISLINNVTKSSSVSECLSSQIRVVLSYFGITSAFNMKPDGEYSIEMNGANAARFKKVFFGQDVNFANSRKCWNDNIRSLFLFKNRQQYWWSGKIYNLEVEEDHSYSIPNATVHNCEFGDDSFGFFKVKSVNAATSKEPHGFPVDVRGRQGKEYILALDPARTYDRAAFCVIELGTPNKLVYCKTFTKKKYQALAMHTRKLCRDFNIVGIAIDAGSGGGGMAVEEDLNKPHTMIEGDEKILRFDDVTNKLGKRILYMINFTSEWIEEANIVLQKSIEDISLMFPMKQLMQSDDLTEAKENCLEDIRELKRELCAIQVTYTKTGKRRFDLQPPILGKNAGAVRHKDRYSSLLMANWLAVKMTVIDKPKNHEYNSMYNKFIGFWV